MISSIYDQDANAKENQFILHYRGGFISVFVLVCFCFLFFFLRITLKKVAMSSFAFNYKVNSK